jgi:quinol monooxygenase YgiN
MINFITFLFLKGGFKMIIVQAKAIPKDETSKNKIIEAAANLIEKSKLENGNINYNLYSNVQEDTLLFVEQWENLDILKAHLQTEHFNQFGADINGLLKEDLDINVFSAENVEL